MKKFIFSLVLMFATTVCFAQKWSFHHYTVNKNARATVYFTNENGETMVKSFKVIINHSQYDKSGNLTGGATEKRDGLMLTPPIRPRAWIKNDNGSITSENYAFNIGCSANTALVFIIEGTMNKDGVIEYLPQEVPCLMNTHDPGNWVSQYDVNSYKIPNFVQPMVVTKNGDGSYSAR